MLTSFGLLTYEMESGASMKHQLLASNMMHRTRGLLARKQCLSTWRDIETNMQLNHDLMAEVPNGRDFALRDIAPQQC